MRSRWMGGFSVDSAPGGGVWRGEKVKATLSAHTHLNTRLRSRAEKGRPLAEG